MKNRWLLEIFCNNKKFLFLILVPNPFRVFIRTYESFNFCIKITKVGFCLFPPVGPLWNVLRLERFVTLNLIRWILSCQNLALVGLQLSLYGNTTVLWKNCKKYFYFSVPNEFHKQGKEMRIYDPFQMKSTILRRSQIYITIQ